MAPQSLGEIWIRQYIVQQRGERDEDADYFDNGTNAGASKGKTKFILRTGIGLDYFFFFSSSEKLLLIAVHTVVNDEGRTNQNQKKKCCQ